MRICDSLIIRTIKKSLYQQGVTRWTELCIRDKVLCHSPEDVDWSENPVQVKRCETCGEFGCAPPARVHISRMGEFVLWSPPIYDPPVGGDPIDLTGDGRFYILDEWGSLLFPISVWEEKVESQSTYPNTTRHNLMLSWLLEYYSLESITNQHEMLSRVRQRLIRGSRPDHWTILKSLEKLVAWFEEAPEQPLGGKLVQANDIDAQIETLYLADPAQEWPAYAIIGGQVYPAFGENWVYLDET
jgi:hypothetical protein